jgi:3D (Asp-Asp-Asp) domain-containing protein
LTKTSKYGIKGHRQITQAILFMTKYSQKLAYILILGSILVNPNPVAANGLVVDPAYGSSVMRAPAVQPSLNTLKPADQAEARYTTERVVTAYSSTVDQCDDTPFITANGTHVRDGIVAANWLKFGTRVRIPEMYGDKVFIVTDRMNPRFADRMDIWMAERSDAIKFGMRRLTIEVL